MLLADVFGPGGSDDGLFDGMSLDLGDLFADDLMGNLLNVSGPSTDLLSLLPCTATPDNLQPAGALQATCPTSSGDSHHGEAPCTRCSSTTNSGLSSGQLFPACNHHSAAAGVTRLPVQRSTGPPTRKAVKQELVRQVTTQQVPVPDEQVARSIAPSPSPPSVSVGNPPAYPAPACFQHDELLAALLRSGGETSEDSDGSDTDEGALAQEGNARKGSNKRKAPEIDWRSITDPAERRRQRRLAKNRMTAARSRERKKVQWADMEAKLARMDSDNKRLKTMLQQLAQENSSLRGQLEGMVQGKQTPGRLEGHSHSTGPAALVFITILLLLCCALPGDQTMLLGSAAPLLLLAQLLSQPSSSSCGHAPSPPPLGTALLRFLATLKLLLSRTSARLRVSVHRMLFRRHYYIGRSTLSKTAAWAASTTSGLLRYRPGLGAPPTSFVSGPSIRIKQEPLCEESLSYIKQEPLDFPTLFDPSSCLVSCLC